MMMCEMMLKTLPENAGLNLRAQRRRGEKSISSANTSSSSASSHRKIELRTSLESRDHE
jgi:hypothetical protein